MKYVIAILSLAFASSSLAAVGSVVDVSKLTPEQRAAIQLQVEQTAAKGKDVSSLAVTVREEASQWADLGKNVGTALVASAKEVGQGVNEFSQTPVGQITTAIIVYKVIGQDLLGLVFGFITIVVGTITALYTYRTLGVEHRKFENIPRLWGLWISRKVTEQYRDNDWTFGSMFVSAIILGVSWVVGLNIIF